MVYPDLYQFPEGHPPSPYDVPIEKMNAGQLVLPAGLTLYAVGWIEEAGFPTGAVPEACIDALLAAYPSKIIQDGTRGLQTCTLCGDELPEVTWKGSTRAIAGYGHFLVLYRKKVYMAPALILHYILDHIYRPPQVFVNATIKGKFLGTEDLKIIPSSQPLK